MDDHGTTCKNREMTLVRFALAKSSAYRMLWWNVCKISQFSASQHMLAWMIFMSFSRQVQDLISDFRGLPRGYDPAGERPPTQLGSLIAVIRERHRLDQDCPERVLVENWSRIFEDSYAERCHPVRIINEDTLVIAINHPVLRSNIMMDSRRYLQRIQSLPMCSGIKRIVARAG